MAQPTTIKSGNPINDVNPGAPKGFSTFDLSHRFLQTSRFGEITPHENFEVVKGSRDSFRLQHDTSSLSLRAPIKSDMFQRRENFFIALQAILPNAWELITAQPNNGDDVPADCDGFVDAESLDSFFDNITSDLNEFGGPPSLAKYLTKYLKTILLCEMFFSQGSLLKNMYTCFGYLLRFNKFVGVLADGSQEFATATFDSFSERFLQALAPRDINTSGIKYFRVVWYDEDRQVTDRFIVVDDSRLSEVPNRITSLDKTVSYRHFLDLCRQNLNFQIEGVSVEAGEDLYTGSALTEAGRDYFFGEYLFEDPDQGIMINYEIDDIADGVNFNNISAYQLVCAHFYSLDHVDYIYSAELYRQMMMFFGKKIIDVLGISNQETFTWNGLDLRYDALSARYINLALICAIRDLRSQSTLHSFAFDYLTALFSFRHSLRYLDYFTGGRTRPLSVGTADAGSPANIDVPVVGNKVNAVEIIIAQQGARYLNFAQRVGRKVSKWLQEFFPGGQPATDYHDPQWLSQTSDAIVPEQTQNTGAAQVEDANSITARFQQNSNKYQFTYMPDRPGYIVCVTYFDIPRAYAYATSKCNMHRDRYDRFNPFFQYNGSQKVDRQELGLAGDLPFSYQGKYMEYKQNYDVVAGGFVENLPGFVFIADIQRGLPMQTNLNPSYVRSWNVELDPFYLALTGYGLAAYFHFLTKNVNIISGYRPMEYAPQLM